MFLISLLTAASVIAAKPLTSPQSWISSDDYPKSIQSAGGEGSVRVLLSVDASGNPVGCTVRTSSGNTALDDLTCKLLQKRARFSPAQDGSGRAVASEVPQAVRWAIPRERLITQGFRMTYSLDSRGHITGCKTDEFGAHDPDLTCSSHGVDQLAQSSLAKPLSDYSQIAVLLAMQVDDNNAIAVLRPESGERQIIAQARINVSPGGIITKCTADVTAARNGKVLDLCGGPVRIGEKAFDTIPGKQDRILTVSFEIIGSAR